MYQATGQVKLKGKTRDVNIMVCDLNDFFQAPPDEQVNVYLVEKNGDENLINVTKSDINLVAITA